MRTDTARQLPCNAMLFSRTKITNHKTEEKRGGYSRLDEVSRRVAHQLSIGTAVCILPHHHFIPNLVAVGTRQQDHEPISPSPRRPLVRPCRLPQALYGKFPMYRNERTARGLGDIVQGLSY